MVRNFEWVADRLDPLGSCESLTAASALLPAGGYTTFRTYGGARVVRFLHHLERLRASVADGGALEEGPLRSAIGAALRARAHPESRVRVTWAPPRLFASVEPFEPLPASSYREGVACVTLRGHRDSPQAKDTRFIATAAGAYRRLPPDAHEGLLVDDDGAILEGLSSNFFATVRGELRTEEARVLPGVTRSIVLDLARALLPVSTVALKVEELGQASEAFITSASREVLPVVRIDGQAIADGRPGPWSRALREAFAALVAREAEPI